MKYQCVHGEGDVSRKVVAPTLSLLTLPSNPPMYTYFIQVHPIVKEWTKLLTGVAWLGFPDKYDTW